MSEQETSRSHQRGSLSLEVDFKPAKDLGIIQCCPDLSSPDSGMGNTVFSSPEKSDKEGNESSDDKEREGSGHSSPGTPHRIKLARNNVYNGKGSPSISRDTSSWNHVVNSPSGLGSRSSPLRSPDKPKPIVLSVGAEHCRDIPSPCGKYQEADNVIRKLGGTLSDLCSKKVLPSENKLALTGCSSKSSDKVEVLTKPKLQRPNLRTEDMLSKTGEMSDEREASVAVTADGDSSVQRQEAMEMCVPVKFEAALSTSHVTRGKEIVNIPREDTSILLTHTKERLDTRENNLKFTPNKEDAVGENNQMCNSLYKSQEVVPSNIAYKSQEVVPSNTVYKGQEIVPSNTGYEGQDGVHSNTAYKSQEVVPSNTEYKGNEVLPLLTPVNADNRSAREMVQQDGPAEASNGKPSVETDVRFEPNALEMVFQPKRMAFTPSENVLVGESVNKRVLSITGTSCESEPKENVQSSGVVEEKEMTEVKGVDSVEKIEVACNISESKNLLPVPVCNNERLKPKDILDVDVDMGIDLDAIRDTESEGGDSICSEDQDMCEGENGCIHQGGVCDTDQNWDYLMDEEFDVPKKPILNGSAEHLERRSSLKRKAEEEVEEARPTKCKRGIQFEGVTVFYFPRSQGFTCVPSQGGSTLGMSRRHSYIRQFSLAEHAVEQRRAHREYLLRLRQQRSARERGDSSSRGSSSEDSEENSEEASDLSDSELDADSYFFLQPLPIRQRRALLRQAGICHIEGLEKEECKDIRVSRELCGCQCKVYCDPDTCECAEAGIRCQVDRHNFPCGCSREGCGNTYGRIEFNPIRVRTHFIHTLMRLEIEKRQHQQQQQQQQWQNQQRAKWLATTSASTNGFSSGSGVASGNLPFFEGSGRETTAVAVTDLNKFSTPVEMASCVGTMNTPLYPHFESRQMLGPGAPPTTYVQQDKTIRYMPAESASLMEPNKDACNDYAAVEAGVNGCSSVGEGSYKIGNLTTSLSNARDNEIVGAEHNERQLTALPLTSHSSSLGLDTTHITSSSKDLTSQAGESTETAENLGEIVKKSIVETVSA